MSLPIKRIIIEGSDLAGKSTLIRNFHKKTKYAYNIHDRSFLSMVVYARQFGRTADEAMHRAALEEELSDLNNFVVILVPPFDAIRKRYEERGDDIQTPDSLRYLHNLFHEEASKLEMRPNVLTLYAAFSPEELVELVNHEMKILEHADPSTTGDMVSEIVHASGKAELQVRAHMLVAPDYVDSYHLEESHESYYFQDIELSFFDKIRREMAGDNPYKTPQGLDSRRFYYSSDTCISSIHFLPRDGRLKAIVTCRSTDVDRNAQLDTRFLAHLTALAAREFGWNTQNKLIDLTINYNSAHIRADLAEKA